MQSSTGQYSTHAGDPAHPVQHSVMTASSFGFFLRAVVIPLERGSCFCSSGTIPAVFATSRSAAMRLGYPHSHRYFVTLRLRLRASYPAWHPSPSRLSSPSRHARAREALADVREIIFLSRGRMHEFVIQVCGKVEKFVHAAIRELQLQSPKGIRILMVSDFGDAVRGNGDPIHLLRAPFRCSDSSSGRLGTPCPVAALVSTLCSACSSWAALRGLSPVACSNSRILMQNFLRNYQILQSL